MEDKILKMFFEPERWKDAISKACDKDMKHSVLSELVKPEVRVELYYKIKEGRYKIAPPHIALIPKDNGDFREVSVNEPVDRVILSIANDLLFELCPEMVHDSCKAYRKGIGCGMVVQELSRYITDSKQEVIGWKSDLSKYFDSVPVSFIDEAFDKVEEKHGHSAVIDFLRDYYHNDWFFDADGNLIQQYKSLKQGCSVASWLADVVLYHIDEKLTEMADIYYRYSDDMVCFGENYLECKEYLERELKKMRMKLNPKKVEFIRYDRWFKFLGFSIKGSDITIAGSRLKTFQKEIEKRTIKHRQIQTFDRKGWTLKRAITAVNRYLYKGDGQHSWATQILPIVNVRKDVDELNKFVMDCLRAVYTGKKKVGGLGYVRDKADGCVVRGKGRNVKTNRLKLPEIEEYMTIGCMQNAIKTRRAVYNTLVAQL